MTRTREIPKPLPVLDISDPSFIATKEFRKFAEFCDACKKSRYIGLCYGPPGVGKTYAATQYTHWDLIEQWQECFSEYSAPAAVQTYDTVLVTPGVSESPREIQTQITRARFWLQHLISASYGAEEPSVTGKGDQTKLIIIDEADRLSALGIEQVRAISDREKIPVIFIGMPGIEKRFARYAQLYSRIGFVHEVKTLSEEEVLFIVERKWEELGCAFNKDDFVDNEALAALVRTTHGNFRLIGRLLCQVQRILEINGLSLITKEVIEAARKNLVIGVE